MVLTNHLQRICCLFRFLKLFIQNHSLYIFFQVHYSPAQFVPNTPEFLKSLKIQGLTQNSKYCIYTVFCWTYLSSDHHSNIGSVIVFWMGAGCQSNSRYVSELVIVPEHQVNNFAAILWRKQVTFRWIDDDVCFVLGQHA